VFSRKAIENGKPIVQKFDLTALEDIKQSLGSYMFSCLYLNEPMRPDDMIFRQEWIGEMESIDIPRDDPDIRWIITVDPAISEKETACDTAIIRCGHLNNMIYVDQCLADHFTPQQTITKIIDMIELDEEKTKWVGIESVAYQKALGMFCKDEMMRRGVIKPIQQINTRSNKDMKIAALQPFFERGQIILRKGLQKLVSQLIQYPHSRLVDCVDCLSMQLDSYTGFRVKVKPEAKVEKFGTTLEDVLKQLHSRRDHKKGRNPTGLSTMSNPLPTGLKHG